MAAAVAGALLVPAGPAAAEAWEYGFAYVWAHDERAPLGSPYTPRANSYNSSGELSQVTRHRTGGYTVRFAGLGPFGTALVTANGPLQSDMDSFCTVLSIRWVVDVGMDVGVHCHNRRGQGVDSRFMATYALPRPGQPAAVYPRRAYVWSLDPSPPLFETVTPSPGYQFNSAGGPSTLVRTSYGRYTVTVPGGSDGQPHVTAYGYLDGGGVASCSIAGPVRRDLMGTHIDVDCGGSDTQFLLQYVGRGSTLFTSSVTRPAGYANVVCVEMSCAVRTGWSTNPSGTITATGVGPGDFYVRFPLETAGGTVNVTVVGGSSIRCRVLSWTPGDGARIVCFGRVGVPPPLVEVWVGFAS